MTGSDRITQIRIVGLRSLADVTIDLSPLTVLIGPNGSGKSSILEAFEILRLLTQGQNFQNEFARVHGGLASLLNHGSNELKLRLRIAGDEGPPLTYRVVLRRDTWSFVIVEESLELDAGEDYPEPLRVIERGAAAGAQYFDQKARKLQPVPNLVAQVPAITAFGQFPPNRAITRLLEALGGIDIHVPFDVGPAWSTNGEASGLRQSNVVQPTTRLDRFGTNLANAYQALRNQRPREWQQTLLEVQAGLGEVVEDVLVAPDPGGGRVALQLRLKTGDLVPAIAISDGMLVYLAFVALYRLVATGTGASRLLAFDEPELHLHPELLARIVGQFEDIATKHPVLLATHSDRLLDALTDPAGSVVLCELDAQGHTRLLRPDGEALAKWLDDFRGLGDVRAEGFESSVFVAEEPA